VGWASLAAEGCHYNHSISSIRARDISVLDNVFSACQSSGAVDMACLIDFHIYPAWVLRLLGRSLRLIESALLRVVLEDHYVFTFVSSEVLFYWFDFHYLLVSVVIFDRQFAVVQRFEPMQRRMLQQVRLLRLGS
jgi:hypothetical protein